MSAPIIPVAAMEPLTRDLACFHLQLEHPGCIVVRHEITPDADEPSGVIRRVVSDETGILLDEERTLSHCCLNCAAKADVVPTLAAALQRQPAAIVWALPLTADPNPMLFEITEALGDGRLHGAHLAHCVAVADERDLLLGLFGDDTLAEREAGFGLVDERAWGEAWCQQLEFADVVATLGAPDARSATVLRHLVAPDAHLTTLDELGALARTRHDHDRAKRRVTPQTWPRPAAEDGEGVWTVLLESSRPLHPGRFSAGIEGIGAGQLRSRGAFWLASRPECAGAWDGSGGQVSIGDAGLWDGTPRTRILVTGIDPADRSRVLRAFADMVLTPAEMAHAHHLRGRDELDPWLGVYPFAEAS